MSMHEGGCLCSKNRYAASAPPTRITNCHCRFCQRATGTAYLVEPIFDKHTVMQLIGTPATYDHRSGGSGKIVTIHFCETCGTKLYLTFERFPDVIGVYAGTFDNPNWFDRAPEISKHIFLDVAMHGTLVPSGVSTFFEHATDNEGNPLEPLVYDEPHQI